MSPSLVQLEQKVNILSEKLNWLLNHLGIDFPDERISEKGLIKHEQQSSNEHNVYRGETDKVKENEENQFSNLIKFRNKRGLTTSPELKVYQNKKRISSSSSPSSSSSSSTVVVNCDKLHTVTTTTSERDYNRGIVIKQVSISNRQKQQLQQQQQNSALEESSSCSSSKSDSNQGNSTSALTIKTDSDNETNYIITQNSTEIVQSPTADNEIEIETIKYEPLEVEIEEAPTNLEETESENTITHESNSVHQQHQIQQHHHHHHQEHETRYRIREENNVLHIIKIESEPQILDGVHTVYSDALPIVQIGHDGNSQLNSNMAVFSGEETAIGFLNADGTVTPLSRPNVIIANASSSSSGLQQFEVLPISASPTSIPPSKPPAQETIDPKGTFVCQVCEQSFTGLYLFRQHEKKSACRRISRLAQQKKNPPVKNNIASSNIIGGSSTNPVVVGKSSVVGDTVGWKSYGNPNLPDASPSSPILKFKCSLCDFFAASKEYLHFHLQKIHALPHTTPD